MAKKLDQVTVKRLKSIGVSAKTEEEAREALLEIMKKSGIDGMESEDLDSLIDIAEAFTDDDAKGGNDDDDDNEEAGEETEEPTEEEEAEELANEAEEEEETEEEVEEPEEEEAEGDEFDEMDRTQLKAYIKEKGLDVKVMKKWDDDTLREAIREAVGAAEEEMGETEEEAEEEQKPQPKKKAAPVTAKEKKEEKKKAEAKPEPKKKDAATAEKKPAKKRGTKLDPKNNADDRKEFGALQKLFPEKDFEYAWLATAGVTVKHKGTNGNRSIITIENCSKQEDGSVKCNAYLLTFTKQKELLDEAGVEYEPCWNGAPSIKGITLDEVIEIVSGFMDNILASVKKIDKKLGENRKKMEENLEKKAAKKPVAKKAAPAPEPDEEEEKPKKKAAAKPAKKAVKK